MSSEAGAVVTQNHETHVKAKNYVFTWVVKNLNFDFLLPPGTCITSPSFQGLYGLYKLKLYPGGLNSNYKNYLSLAIVIDVDKTYPIYIKSLVISLVNNAGKEMACNSICIRSVMIEESLPVFVLRSKITSDFLPNGELTIKCKGCIYIDAEHFENAPIESIKNQAKKRRLVELDDFEKLLKDNRFSDFKVIVGSQTFYTHKNILAARSRYFADLFESRMKEVKEGEIHITDISENIMREILRFIYTGKIDVVEMTMTMDLLKVADMYGLDGLTVMCQEAIISNISLENIGSILNHIERPGNVGKLKDSVIEFLKKNAKKLSRSESFRKVLDSLSPSFMVEIMNTMMSKMLIFLFIVRISLLLCFFK